MEKKVEKKPAPAALSAENTLAEIIIAALVLLLLVPFVISLINIPGGLFASIGNFFLHLHSMLKTFATIFTLGAFAVTAYSFIMIEELAHEDTKKLKLAMTWETEKKQKNARWQKVEEHMQRESPSDWKIAILEADNILDEVTKRMGYSGSTLGERLRIIPRAEFPMLEEAWEAHKFRNALAHKGTDFPLAKSDADRIINIYYRIFTNLGYL